MLIDVFTAIKTSVKGNPSGEKKNSRLIVHSLFDYIFPTDLVFSFKLHQKSYGGLFICQCGLDTLKPRHEASLVASL